MKNGGVWCVASLACDLCGVSSPYHITMPFSFKRTFKHLTLLAIVASLVVAVVSFLRRPSVRRSVRPSVIRSSSK